MSTDVQATHEEPASFVAKMTLPTLTAMVGVFGAVALWTGRITL
jgi:hypothetical protein